MMARATNKAKAGSKPAGKQAGRARRQAAAGGKPAVAGKTPPAPAADPADKSLLQSALDRSFGAVADSVESAAQTVDRVLPDSEAEGLRADEPVRRSEKKRRTSRAPGVASHRRAQ